MSGGRGKTKIRSREGGYLIAVMGDEDTVTGFLLSGIGTVDNKKVGNFFVVTAKTPIGDIENTFKAFTTREDIAVILITQNVANDIRHLVNDYDSVIPSILEIPSKDHPYDPHKDTLLTRVLRLTGIN